MLKYGMKRDFNSWLKSLGAAAPVKTLDRAARVEHRARRRPARSSTGSRYLDISDEMDVEKDRARYEADRAKDIRLGGTHGIDEVMKAERLDAILFPGASGAGIAAKPGYPTVIVPFALVPNAPTPAFPAGFDAKPGPFGVSFTGMACSEPKLIELAYAFEQATKKRVPPAAVPSRRSTFVVRRSSFVARRSDHDKTTGACDIARASSCGGLRLKLRRQPPPRPTASVNTQPRVDVLGMPRPIEMHDSVWIEDLTMMEVRDLIKAGKTTALILTGGIEENGPYLTTGKHNNVLRVDGRSDRAGAGQRADRADRHARAR